MNSVQHFEIPADDMKRAKEFYKTVFGWQILPFNNATAMVSTTPTGDDGIPQKPGAINGDISKRTTVFQHPLIVVTVPNIEQVFKDIEAAGGRALSGKIPIPGMGNYAYVQDSEKNVIGVWEESS